MIRIYMKVETPLGTKEDTYADVDAAIDNLMGIQLAIEYLEFHGDERVNVKKEGHC